jgi:photosynthetic reaction center H subunit
MPTGALTAYLDVAQVVLYLFWIFFAGLILYLRREDKREGYPLESDRSTASGGRVRVQGFPSIPLPKFFRPAHGPVVQAPSGKVDTRNFALRPTAGWPGAPQEPTGNPMLDGVGPAAYAMRADTPDPTIDGQPKIVPLRVATDFALASRDPDPRGMDVVGADGVVGGTVADAWVDRSEPQIRYLEVAVNAPGGKRHVLLPIAFAKINGSRRRVTVKSILGRQFADVPGQKHADTVTLLEEDRISAYYAGGTLYATPARLGPIV